MKKLSSLSVVLPAYNDEHTIGGLIAQLTRLLPKLAQSYEIIVVNDASSDKTGEVLAQMREKIAFLGVVTHKKNQGYGGALLHGFSEATKEYIFYTDSDGQYDVLELPKLVSLVDKDIAMVTGFKIRREDAWFRKLIGSFYNTAVKMIFGISVKDIDCDFRLFRRKILQGLSLKVTSGAFDLEFMTRVRDKGVRIKEVPIHHYPRKYGTSQVFTPFSVSKSIWDVLVFWFIYEKNSFR